MMNINDTKIIADFQPIIDAHNAFMEKHGIEASGDMLLAMCVMFIKDICDGDGTTMLAFVADFCNRVLDATDAEDSDSAVQ